MKIIKKLCMLCVLFSSQLLANQVNLVHKDTWGDQNYGMMQVHGTDVYIASGGVLILDLETPATPLRQAHIAIDSNDRTLKFQKVGTTLFILTSNELFIVDTLDINQPEQVSSITPIANETFEDFVVKDNMLILASSSSPYLAVYNIDNLTSPGLMTSTTSGANSNVIALAAVDAGLVYASNDSVKLLSLSIGTLLNELYTDVQSFNNEIIDTPVNGNLVYFADGANLVSYNFSDLQSVQKTTVSATDANISQVSQDGNTMAIIDIQGYLYLYNLTDPSSPTLAAKSSSRYSNSSNLLNFNQYTLLANSIGIEITSGFVDVSSYNYLTNGTNLSSNGQLFSSPGYPSRLYTLEDGIISSTAEIVNSSAFSVMELADTQLYAGRDSIYDIADLDNIFLSGSYSHDAGGQSTSQKIITETDLYSRSSAKVTGFTKNSPTDLVEKNEVNTSDVSNGASSQSTKLVKVDNHFFLGTTAGLYHYFEDESNQTQIVGGVLGSSNWVSALEASGDFVYAVNNGGTELNVWDVSERNSPALVETIDTTTNEIYASTIYKHWLLLFSDDDGMLIYDISSPESPVFLEAAQTSFAGRKKDLIAHQDHLLLSYGTQIASFFVNEAPAVNTQTLNAQEDTELTQLLDVVNLEDDPLTFEVTENSSNGDTQVDSNGNVTYSPNPNYNGADEFTVRVSDHLGGDVEKVISVVVESINDLPVAGENSQLTDEDISIEGLLVATDVDGDTLTYSLETDASNGEVTVDSNGQFSYQPNVDFNGSDNFSFSIDDGIGEAVVAQVTITINAINDAPTLSVSELSLDEDSSAEDTAEALDVDNSELSFSLSQNPSNGTAEVDQNGIYRYQPTVDFNGSDSFQISVSDGELTTTQEVVVTVSAVNDAPVANDLSATANSGASISQSLMASDVDSDNLTFEIVSSVSNGTLNLSSNGTFTYQSTAEFSGTDTFTFKVSDGDLESAVATVTIRVNKVAEESPEGGGGALHWLSILVLLAVFRRKFRT